MRTIRDIPLYADIPILVRAALNVPIKNGEVANQYRLQRALPTLRYLIERRAKVVLIGHIEGAGLPAGRTGLPAGRQGTETLAPVATALSKLIPGVSFCPEVIGERVRQAVRDLAPGHILMLENLRRDKGEQRNDPLFAQELAALADIFVEDSFDTCHRTHASIVGVPRLLPSYAGLLLEEEIRELSRALTPTHPALAVIGGVKFSTKEPVLTTLLTTYDHVFVGGALANNFLKAVGQPVGKSLFAEADQGHIEKLLDNPKLILPLDSLVIPADAVGMVDARSRARIAAAGQVQPDEIILDHGPGTSALLAHLAQKSKTILWNGPLGRCESGFTDTTDAFARAVAASSAHSVVGGGDTVASIENLGLFSHFSFISTGGGAMLDFLAEGTLPGIEALGS